MTGRPHAPAIVYDHWLSLHFGPTRRLERQTAYDVVCDTWPTVEDWLAAPLDYWHGPSGASRRAIGTYLMYLSLIEGVPLPYWVVLCGGLSPFARGTVAQAYGADPVALGRYAAVLSDAMGISTGRARRVLAWSLGAALLHRGTPDLGRVGGADLTKLAWAASAWSLKLPDVGRPGGPGPAPVTGVGSDAGPNVGLKIGTAPEVLLARVGLTVATLATMGQISAEIPCPSSADVPCASGDGSGKS